jgi:CDP-paratose 2-epimerase
VACVGYGAVSRDGSKRVLVTGGAGFVGSSLCLGLKSRHPGWEILALDNLKRRGSELNLVRLHEAGVDFVHGDVRQRADVLSGEPVDAIVECSAEPSAVAGLNGGLSYLVDSNLVGALHCLERARRDGAAVVFLSTSRVYPVAALDALAYDEGPSRFELRDSQEVPGASAAGIAEDFTLHGARTLYGATKLAAELLIAEYVDAFELPAVVLRCGVIAGPGQMGKADQGVFTHWLLAHWFGLDLNYIGYGGRGKQVRDLLHIEDLVELVEEPLVATRSWSGRTFNVGGGPDRSLSLLETTALCRELTGREVPIASVPDTRRGDVRIYLSDCSRLFAHTEWRPSRSPRDVLTDTCEWIAGNERSLEGALF